MRTTTRQVWATFCLVCTALLLATPFTACSDSDDPEVPDKPDTPVTPVNPEDYQAVPVSGGTIEKGDIAITFPSGTFTKDEQVAITEVKKGEIGGKNEASPFYQVTMPCTAGKPLTIRMKSLEKDEDIAFVAYSNAYCMSENTEKKAELTYNTTYSNGEYYATIPAINGDVEGESVSFTIGLGYMPSDPAMAKTRGLADKVLQEGKVGTVTYKIRFPWWTRCTYDSKTLGKLEGMSSDIASYVQSALTEIFDLGFTVNGEKTLYIDFSGDDGWGGFQACGIPGEGGWSMWVSLGIKKLLDAETTERDIKCTVIHEILHWFQSISYDPRSNFKKSKKEYSGEGLVMYEMGAVWSEQFMNNGKMVGSFLAEYLDGFLKSALDPKAAGTSYDKHGYGMSSLLYYITKTGKIKENKVVDMYDIWNVEGMSDKSIEPFKQWLTQNHCKILENDNYYDYVFQLFSGKLIDDKDHINPANLAQATLKTFSVQNDDKVGEKTECNAYGITSRQFKFSTYRNSEGVRSLKGREIIIKQTEPNVMTFVVACADIECKTFKAYDKKIEPGDSLVINGDAAEALFGTGMPYAFYVISVNSNNFKQSANITCEVRSSIPQNISELYLGGTVLAKRTIIRLDGKKETNNYPYYPWAKLNPDNNTTINGTLTGTTLHVDATARNNHEISESEDAMYRISFDVENFVPNYKTCKLVNLDVKVNRNGKTVSESCDVDYKMEWGLKAKSIAADQILYIPGSTSYFTFKATVKGGLEIDSYYYKEENEYTPKNGWEVSDENAKSVSSTYVDDPNNYLEIRFEFNDKKN